MKYYALFSKISLANDAGICCYLKPALEILPSGDECVEFEVFTAMTEECLLLGSGALSNKTHMVPHPRR
jgi:hypothetical protein